MTESPDGRTEKEVRKETIEDLIESNDLNDLIRMRREMCDEIEDASDERETELLEYRLDILLEAIDRLRT